jgi:hypothetical protein
MIELVLTPRNRTRKNDERNRRKLPQVPQCSNVHYRRPKNDADQQDELQELTLMSLNIRAFNGEEKQQIIGELIHQEKPHVICLNETKLTIPVYLDNYWSHQTVL